MIKYYDEKLTPNEMAKTAILDRLENAYCVTEHAKENHLNASDREIREINRLIEKHIARIEKFLNL